MTMILELKALACLLIYPDEELIEELPEIELPLVETERISDEYKEGLVKLLGWYRGGNLTEIQSSYVSTFDIGKQASLNLFEHTQGDSKDRGNVMVELVQLYKEHGLELDTTELPDYLPVFLEFLSGLEFADAIMWLESVQKPLSKIDRELQLEDSPWDAVTGALMDFAKLERDTSSIPESHEMPLPLDAEYYESPITFGSAIDPAAGCPKFQHP